MMKSGLIESDWNLKYVARIKSVASARINRIRLEFKVPALKRKIIFFHGLIESDWNLKFVVTTRPSKSFVGLIESDWNLKYLITTTTDVLNIRINRIRLEFKVNKKNVFGGA